MEQDIEQEADAAMNQIRSHATSADPFAVPEGYFEALPAHIFSRLALEEILKPSEEIFEVPGDYFNRLEERINASVFAESLKEQVAEGGFSVPENYFENLTSKVQNQALLLQKTPKIRRLGSWINYAAAASVVLVLGTAVFLNQKKLNVDEQLAAVPDQEIIQYLQVHSDPGDTELIKESIGDTNGLSSNVELTQTEIENYLKNTL